MALVEEMEGGNNPVLQYNDSLKTKGLVHAIPLVANMVQRSSNKTLTELAREELRSRSKTITVESASKRIKSAGPNNNDEGNVNKKQKDPEGRLNNNPLTVSKSDSTGVKGNASSQKHN